MRQDLNHLYVSICFSNTLFFSNIDDITDSKRMRISADGSRALIPSRILTVILGTAAPILNEYMSNRDKKRYIYFAIFGALGRE